MRAAGRRHVVITDFDGTVMKTDLPNMILCEFGLEGWWIYDELAERGEMSYEESIRRQYAMIRAHSKHELLTFIRQHCTVRRGFSDLVRMCEALGARIVVASGGLDFCITYALEQNGLSPANLKVICPRSTFSRAGVRAVFRESQLLARGYGNFKETLVARHQEMGRRVIFVGDGFGDLPAASRADKVFAIRGSKLEEKLRETGSDFTGVSDFLAVVKYLDHAARFERNDRR